MARGKNYYAERAAYMRSLAETAATEALKISCLRAAEEYEALLTAATGEAAAQSRQR